jgi:hypothetical protein
LEPGKVVETPPAKGKVFISYSRKDMAFANRLEVALRERGFEPLIDSNDIYAFEDWWQRIEGLLAQSDTVIFILSSHSISSEVALKEVGFASSLKKRFAPVACGPVDFEAIPGALARLNVINFHDGEAFEKRADELAVALATDIEWLRKHTEFGELGRRWSQAGHPVGLLLRSPNLEEAERWIASRPDTAPSPDQATLDFVAESRRAATRRQRRLVAGSLAGAAVAIVLAVLAVRQTLVAKVAQFDAEQQRNVANEQTKVATEQTNVATEQTKIAGKRLIEARENLVASLVAQTDFEITRYDLVSALRSVLKAADLEATYAGKDDERKSDQALRQVLAEDRLILHLERDIDPWGWPFDFINDHILLVSSSEQGLFAIDLRSKTTIWHLDLPGVRSPGFMVVVDDFRSVLIGGRQKLAIVDRKKGTVLRTIDLSSNMVSLAVTHDGDLAAVALDRSILLFDPRVSQKAPKPIPIEIGAGEAISKIAFDRSGNRMYIAVSPKVTGSARVLEYLSSTGQIKPVKTGEAETLADASDVSAYGVRDRGLIYWSHLQQKIGIFNAATGMVSDLRAMMLRVWSMSGGAFSTPAGLHYLHDETLDERSQLFAIARSEENEVMTVAVQLVGDGEKLYNLHQIKYRLRDFPSALVRGCRVSADDGFLACFYSVNSKDGILVWNMADVAAAPGTREELRHAAEAMLKRHTESDAADKAFGIEH